MPLSAIFTFTKEFVAAPHKFSNTDGKIHKSYVTALAWSPERFHALPRPQQELSSVWLTRKAASPEMLLELWSLGLPVTLIIKPTSHSLRWANQVSGEYKNIVGHVLEPLNEQECTVQMSKIRHVLMRRQYEIALEKLLSEQQKTDSPFAPPDNADTSTDESTFGTIPMESIVVAEIHNQYVALFDTLQKRYILHQSLAALVAQAQADTPPGKRPPLVRVHDKYAVNPAFVREVRRSDSKRDYFVSLKDGREIKMSRTYKNALQYLPTNNLRLHTKRKTPASKQSERKQAIMRGGGTDDEALNNSTQKSKK